MKICLVTHDYLPWGASGMYLNDLVNGLIKKGVEVVVVTNLNSPGLKEYEKNGKLTIYRVKQMTILFNNFEFILKPFSFLEDIYKKENFDILMSEHVFPIYAGGVFAQKHKIPHIGVIEGLSKVSLYSKAVYATHRVLLPMSSFDVLVSWSKFMNDEYFLPWGIPEEKIKIIPACIDTERFNPDADGSEFRKKWQEGDEKIIFTAKPLYKTNALGIAYTIKAMKYVIEKYKNCKYIISGEGRKLEFLRDLANKEGLSSHVKLLGAQNRSFMPNYYKAADIIANSYIYRHAGSMAALESLSSGTAEVITRTECLPGMINIPPPDIAMLTEMADPKDIARGMLTLLQDDALRKKMGANARKFIKDNFSVERVASEYLALFKSLQ